ncbi:MAG: enoyl-CoA hydratase/isomerase family protein [Bacteriovoracaceae bacterium]|nr:enoyl-CoA hydratase/isomerase family protein [Bacteriovoracaceae bacterium]
MSENWNDLKYLVDKNTAIITINRPQVYNALTRDAKLEIIQAIRTANRDENIKAIILTGEGKAFSSGQDLNDRTVQAGENSVDLGHTLETEWNPLVNAIRDSKKIVIGAVNGVAAGAGLSVALACDLITSKPNVKFVSGFTAIGLAPDAGSTFTFLNALGYQKTLEFFLFNTPLFSEDLNTAGMINYVGDDYLEKAKEWSTSISSMAPLSLELIKKNLKLAMDSSYSESMTNETSTQRFLGNSKDYQEGLKSFFEKRKPEFKGE